MTTEEENKAFDNALDRALETDLGERKVTDSDIDFVFECMKKEAPYDEISLKQITYGGFSAFTKLPLNHTVNSRRSGAGKTYDLTLSMGYFPQQYVLSFIGMSDKALMHEQGQRVIIDEKKGNTIPIDPIINDKQTQLDEIEDKIEDPKVNPKDKKDLRKQTRQIANELRELVKKSDKLIDLNNRIIIMLDTPQEGLYNTLMSLVSQDTEKDQIYQFAEKNSTGKMGSPKNRLRGAPAMFTTQVIDDTRQVRHGEKNRRFIHVTPNTSEQKVNSARSLIGQRYGLIPDEYDDKIIDRGDKERVNDIISIIVERLIDHSKLLKHKQSGVKVPFTESIAVGIRGDNTEWSMTVMDRLMRYLAIITKVHMDSRPKIIDTITGVTYPIATFADLRETLDLMQVVASPLRAYLSEWYSKVFLPRFRELDGPNKDYDNEGDVLSSEKYKGLTTEQLANATFDKMKIAITPTDVRKQYLYPLQNLGIIDTVRSNINGNELICFPVEDGSIFSIFTTNDDLRLTVPEEFYPDKRVLEESYGFLLKHDASQGVIKNNFRYRLVDPNDVDISIQELIDSHIQTPDLCFKVDSNSENKNNLSPPPWRRDLTGLQKNGIEQSSDASNGSDATTQIIKDYAVFYGGYWHCKHCKAMGDRPFMDDHIRSHRK